jgi:hypothetical protein
MPYKLAIFTQSFFNYLIQDLHYKPLDFVPINKKETDELENILDQGLNPQYFFNDLTRISIKKAHDKFLTLESDKLFTDDVLSVSQTELVDDFIKAFTVEVIYIMFNYGERNSLIQPKVTDVLCRNIQRSIFYEQLLLSFEAKNEKAYLALLDIIHTIIDFFVESGFFSKKLSTTSKNRNGRQTTTIQLILPQKLEVTITRPLKFPNIVQPSLLKKRDVDYLIKPLINGKGDLTKSDHLVSALNISRTTPYRVNEPLLILIKQFLYSEGTMGALTGGRRNKPESKNVFTK